MAPTAAELLARAVEDEHAQQFARLGREDEEFRKKILDLHRKLSDCDEESMAKVAAGSSSTYPQDNLQQQQLQVTLRRLRELEMVAQRAEETFDRNTQLAQEAVSTGEKSEGASGGSPQKPVKKKRVEFEDLKTASESTFLNRLRLRKRSLKLLGFLSSKSQDSGTGGKAQEERAARLLKMYLPDKAGPSTPKTGPNTIAIHHTSRDRRFWKLRNRRRSSST